MNYITHAILLVITNNFKIFNVNSDDEWITWLLVGSEIIRLLFNSLYNALYYICLQIKRTIQTAAQKKQATSIYWTPVKDYIQHPFLYCLKAAITDFYYWFTWVLIVIINLI